MRWLLPTRTIISRSVLFALALVVMSTSPASAVSYYSCEIAQEKLVKAQRALTVADRALRDAQREEELLRTELWTCLPGGVVSLARTQRCDRAHHGLPDTMKQTIETTYRVEQWQQTVHDRHAWQTKVCGVTP